MGSSWVGLGQGIPEDRRSEWLGVTYGFWVTDQALLVCLSALGEAIDANADAPTWMKALREEWRDAYQGVGVVVTGFAEHLTDEPRRAAFAAVVRAVLDRLLAFGGDYRRAFPSTLCVDDEGDGDVGLSGKIGLIEVCANFVRLLQGGIHAGEHSRHRWGYGPG